MKDIVSVFNEDNSFNLVAKHCIDKTRWEEYRKRYVETSKCNMEYVGKYPLQIDFELNGTCNYKCKSCSYVFEDGDKRPEISFDDYTKIIDEGINNGLMAVRFNYHNEPLIKKDISKYIRYAKDKGVVDTYLSTNGSLLDEEMSINLCNAGLDRLQISIDAIEEDTYKVLRPGGNYTLVVNNVIQFIKIRNKMKLELPVVRVNFVKQEENGQELEKFIDFWQKNEVNSIGIQTYQDINVKEINLMKYDDVKFRCGLPFNHLVIRNNGDILPCCSFYSRELVIGNIYKNDLQEIWQGKQIEELRRLHMTDEGWKQNPVCKRCVVAMKK